MTECARCPREVVQPKTGRRRVYCSSVCRRQAEYDLRRTNAQLAIAEKRLMEADARRCTAVRQEDVEKWSRLVAFWDEQCERLNEWLGTLLAQRGDDSEAGSPAAREGTS